MIKVLIVDDAVAVRQHLAQRLALEPDLEIVGTAANGSIALKKIPHAHPDILVLDYHMPDMDGLATLEALKLAGDGIPVIMMSALSDQGAQITLQALANGARDFVPKPSKLSGGLSEGEFMQDLAEKIRLHGRPRAPESWTPRPRPAPVKRAGDIEARLRSGKVNLVVIGTSTGGPNALTAVLAALPARFPVPIVIVQHMPPLFTKSLAKMLSASGPLPVVEAEHGVRAEAGRVYVAPGNFHVTLAREDGGYALRLNQDQPENSCRPAVDVLFRSAADVCGAGCLAVVLTGMGQDGLRGCEALHAAGAPILIQDEASSVVWGMPGAVARAGLEDRTLPLDAVGPEIARRVLLWSAPGSAGNA